MTRINSNIDPVDLIDQHLLAEYREIVRIPSAVKRMGITIHNRTIPRKFTLGKGHVTFFYNKLAFLHHRFKLLKDELQRRQYATNITDEVFLTDNLDFQILYQNMSDADKHLGNQLIIDRISEKLTTMKSVPKWNKKPINPETYIQNLRKKYQHEN